MSLRNVQRLSGAVLPVLLRSFAAEGSAAASTVYAAQSNLRPLSRNLKTSPYCFSLGDRIKQELEYETSQSEDSEALMSPPNGFKLDETALKTVLTLTKTSGDEHVAVEINTLDQNEADMDIDEDDAEAVQNYPISFVVGVTKGDSTLKFMCTYLEDDTDPPTIDHVAIEPKGGYPSGDLGSVFEGPSFEELDEKLQSEFQEYLAERGITAEVGQYLCRANYDKEQREYVAWLERVHKFVAA